MNVMECQKAGRDNVRRKIQDNEICCKDPSLEILQCNPRELKSVVVVAPSHVP